MLNFISEFYALRMSGPGRQLPVNNLNRPFERRFNLQVLRTGRLCLLLSFTPINLTHDFTGFNPAYRRRGLHFVYGKVW